MASVGGVAALGGAMGSGLRRNDGGTLGRYEVWMRDRGFRFLAALGMTGNIGTTGKARVLRGEWMGLA